MPCESSAKQMIYMKCQALFSLKIINFRLSSATVLYGALWVKIQSRSNFMLGMKYFIFQTI